MHRWKHVYCWAFRVAIDVHGSRNPDLFKPSRMKSDRAIILSMRTTSQMYGILAIAQKISINSSNGTF